MPVRAKALIVAVIGSLALVAGAFATVTVYRNGFTTASSAAAFNRLGTGRCARSLDRSALAIKIGSGTTSCTFRSPVVGRNVQLAADAGISGATPRRLRSAVGTAVVLRADEEGAYSFTVFQGTKRWTLSRVRRGGGEVLQEGRLNSIRRVGRFNRLLLRAFGDAIAGSINGKVVARYTETTPGETAGGFAGIAVAGSRSANGAVGRFDAISIQVPDPK